MLVLGLGAAFVCFGGNALQSLFPATDPLIDASRQVTYAAKFVGWLSLIFALAGVVAYALSRWCLRDAKGPGKSATRGDS